MTTPTAAAPEPVSAEGELHAHLLNELMARGEPAVELLDFEQAVAGKAEAAATDALASRFLRILAGMERERERNVQAMTRELEYVRAHYEGAIERLRRSASYFERALERMATVANFGPRAKSRAVPGGTYGRRTKPARWEVVDEERARQWAAEHHPEAVQVSIVLALDDFRILLTDLSGEEGFDEVLSRAETGRKVSAKLLVAAVEALPPADENGEVHEVPGVVHREAEETPYFKLAKDGPEAPDGQ